MEKTKKILSIQALRAVAATLVVISHAQLMLLDYTARGAKDAFLNTSQASQLFGDIGVDIFFVISGVVMTLVSWNSFSYFKAIPLFFKKRVIRIFPIYWFHLSIWIVIYAFFSKHLTSQPVFDGYKALSSVFLLPASGTFNIFPERYTLGVAWTLSFELYFYFIVAFCLIFKRRYFFPLVSCIFIFGNLFLSQFVSNYPIFHIFSSSLLMEFIYGMFIGYLLRLQIKVPTSLALALTILAPFCFFLAKFGYIPFPRGFSVGIPAFMLVFGFIFLEQNNKVSIPKWLASFGDSSYSLYLSHVLVLSCSGKILTLSGILPKISADLLIFILSLICLLAGYFAYIIIEKPLLKFLTKL